MTNNQTLILEDGAIFEGSAFGAANDIAGEVVFNTGMVGYPETLTDPSYKGQILVLTYPLIGNYGVPEADVRNGFDHAFESEKIQISGLIVSQAAPEHNHWKSAKSLHQWLNEYRIPAIEGVDTRALTKRLREKGTMLGRLSFNGKEGPFYDPNNDNLVKEVSIQSPRTIGNGAKRIILVDCGCKNGILKSLLKRDATVVRVPWDYDFLDEPFDGVLISNGPGNPKMCVETITNVQRALARQKPVFGICLGNQILSLAAGADTYKLKFGHRSQNQPCIRVGTKQCFITSQNHGFAVDQKTLPSGWEPWFENGNDGTNEGIRHRKYPFFSVQFHPEGAPGPMDTDFLFDEFIGCMR